MTSKIEVQENSIAIVGWHDGSAGQIDAWIEKAHNYSVACFINPTDDSVAVDAGKVDRDAKQFSYPSEDSFKDKPFINSSLWTDVLPELGINKVLVTTDDPSQRLDHINQARSKGFELISAIHPTAIIMEEAVLHQNIILYPGSFVGYRTELYDGTVVISSHLDHHNVIKECVTIDPGVVTAGNVTIGSFSRVHTGATIKNRIRVGKNSIIGAGTVVIEDVPDNVTVVGVPGKIIKNH